MKEDIMRMAREATDHLPDADSIRLQGIVLLAFDAGAAAAVKKEREELKAEFRNFGGLKDGYSCASIIEEREMEHDAAIREKEKNT